MRHSGTKLTPSLGLVALFAFCVAAARADEPNPKLKPNHGTVELKHGFAPDPFSKKLSAGGGIKTELGGVKAHVPNAPSFKLHYTAEVTLDGSLPLPLRIYVESKHDTTLLIKLPDGTWVANDDGGGGTNPQLRFGRPQSGWYTIWVGTFGHEKTPVNGVGATLYISERTPVKGEPVKKIEPVKPAPAGRVIVCGPVDWVQVNLDAGLGWFGRDVPGIREAPETKDSLTAMLKKHGFETQHKGVKGKGDSVKLQLFARLTKESRTPSTTVPERADREVKAIADMVYGGAKAVGKKVYLTK